MIDIILVVGDWVFLSNRNNYQRYQEGMDPSFSEIALLNLDAELRILTTRQVSQEWTLSGCRPGTLTWTTNASFQKELTREGICYVRKAKAASDDLSRSSSRVTSAKQIKYVLIGCYPGLCF